MSRPPRGPGEIRTVVRAATRADTPAILSINRAGMPGVGELGQADVERFLGMSPFFRVAERAGLLAAYLIGVGSEADYDGEEFLWFRERFSAFLYVDQIAVAAEARGAGVASRLYAELESFAGGRGVPLLALEVNLRPMNRPSLLFHERQRFSEVGRLETADGRLVSLQTRSIAKDP